MKIRIDSEGRDVTDLYGLHDESDTILEVGMFSDWKVGQTGWVRLRNGKVARAIHCGFYNTPVRLDFFGDFDRIDWVWVYLDGSIDFAGKEHSSDALAHLPDCTGFDWEEPPKPHVWKVGDWFVVDKRHEVDDLWFTYMNKYLGIPQCVVYIDQDWNLKANGYWWNPSWCRPCDPPKSEPAPTRFQPSIEYVGIHDAI